MSTGELGSCNPGSDLLNSRVGILSAMLGVLLTVLTTTPSVLGKVLLSRLLIDTYVRAPKCRHLNLSISIFFEKYSIKNI